MSCIAPFLPADNYNNTKGFVDGRFCSDLTGTTCCLPCPLTDWVYPDNFYTLSNAVDWIAVIGTILCVGLLLSWLVLPVDKTHRHYLSISLTTAVVLMNLGFVIPLAGQPSQCADAITPNDMQSSGLCAASGTFVILGGWSGIMWVFLRSLSLHLQICWQVVVGRSFMWLSHASGWGIPVLGTILAIVFSGVSFRFGTTCHINHDNSLADLWVPLLLFAGLTIIVQLVTFGYCIKVYLASLSDQSASTEGSGLPSYSNSIHTMTPRQAYRRVRRVIQLQWRGIAIVIIIVIDVIFFSIVFVFQDNTVAAIKTNPEKATGWLICLATHDGDKNQCLSEAAKFTVNEATIGAVLILLAMNGIWLVLFLGRWSMIHGWIDLLTPASKRSNKREFVSVDARLDDLKKDTRSYEMLSRDASSVLGPASSRQDNGLVTNLASTTGVVASVSAHRQPDHMSSMSPILSPPMSPDRGATDSPTPLMDLNMAAMGGMGNGASIVTPPAAASHHHHHYNSYSSSSHQHHHHTSSAATASAATASASAVPSGRRTPDYFGHTARYNAPARSFSNPRPPTATSTTGGAGVASGPGPASVRWEAQDSYAPSMSPPPNRRADHVRTHSRFSSRAGSRGGSRGGSVDYDIENRHPLGMNRI